MGAKSLKLDSLDLDLENPRITLAADQRDAMQKIDAPSSAACLSSSARGRPASAGELNAALFVLARPNEELAVKDESGLAPARSKTDTT